MRVNIIGAGLAGCALAYVLKKKGAEPVIYEAGSCIAGGASGNEVGLYNPRFTADFDGIGKFYSAAFFEALNVFKELQEAGHDIGWNPCGALHLVNDEKKARRFSKTVRNWGWDAADMRMVDAQEASDISGVSILSNCLYLSKSGKISPKIICAAYAQGVEVHLDAAVHDLTKLDGDVTVLACGMGVSKFEEAKHLPLRAVRGQVSYIEASAISQKLRCTLGYGGYIAPAENGVHCVGSTFQRWLDHGEIVDSDDQENIDKLSASVPALAGRYKVVNRRAAVRTTSKDHMPIVGQIDHGLYVSTAHGSHGILSSYLSACYLSNSMLNVCKGSEFSFMKECAPDRFPIEP